MGSETPMDANFRLLSIDITMQLFVASGPLTSKRSGVRTWASAAEIARLLLMRRAPRLPLREEELWRFRVLGAIIPDLDQIVAMDYNKAGVKNVLTCRPLMHPIGLGKPTVEVTTLGEHSSDL
jgi:hypothetical protein